MSFGSTHDTKERVRQAIDIVDLIGSYLQLRREGRAFKALCPWHDDTRPSLQVNPQRQSFRCWVCDIGGDVFSFLMKMENIAFPEAMVMLAERAGIELKPERRDEAATSASGSATDKRTLYEVMAWAERQYHECLLKAPEAEPARRYLKDRGITQQSVEKFRLGFSPESWDWIINRARQTRFTPPILEAVGLVMSRQNGPGHYDRFRGRVLFSIRDAQGRPVGLGGRILPETASTAPPGAKYINTPETALFSKSSLLYGLDIARSAITKSRAAVVVEGYTDCIVAWQAGFENVVAVLGTALGERHLRKVLRPLADSIILVLDGDEAGQRRTNEILEMFVAEQVELRVLTLPQGLDPCDFISQRGGEAFTAAIEQAVDALEHAFRVVTGGLDLRSRPHEAHQALERLLQVIAKAPRLRSSTTSESRLREWTMLNRLARLFEVDEEMLRERTRELRGKQRTSSRDAATESVTAAINHWDRQVLELLIERPECVAEMAAVIRPEDLGSPVGRHILEKAYAWHAEGESADFDRLLLEFDDSETQSLLVQLDEGVQAKGGTEWESRLRDVLSSFRRREKERQFHSAKAALKDKRLEESEETLVLQQLIEHERSRQGISVSTDG